MIATYAEAEDEQVRDVEGAEVLELLGERLGRVEAVAGDAARIHDEAHVAAAAAGHQARVDERLDERLRELGEVLDQPDPEADVEDLLEDAGDVVAAAERRPEAEQDDLDADERSRAGR